MGRSARAFALIAITASILAGGTTPCWAACACPPRTPKQILKVADAAFIGSMEGAVFLDAGRSIQTFRVEQVYEGILGETVSVHVGLDGDCPSVYFPQGERVAVVARLQPDGSYIVASCDLVVIEDMERFGGPARDPLPARATSGPPVAASPADTGTELPFWAVVILGAIAAVVLIGLATRRRTRAGRRDEATSAEEASG